MSKASTQTLLKQIESGKVDTDKGYILKFIKQETFRGCTLLQMLDTFTMKQSTITARLSELYNDGLIYISKIIIENGSHYSVYHFEPDPYKQELNRKKVEEEKLNKAIRGLLSKFPNRIPEVIQKLSKNA